MHGKESCANQITLELRQEWAMKAKQDVQHQIHLVISFYTKNKSELPSNITITKLSNIKPFSICRALFSLTKYSFVPF